ncbi:MAG: hydrolase [Streptosporangiales bacterium]|nr:hydrolase [Streptosporangiales bacterium]
MYVAAHQFDVSEDKDTNLQQIRKAVHSAAEAGARLAVLPEAAMVAFEAGRERIRTAAEPMDGPFVTGLRELSKETGTAVIVGVHEPSGQDRVYNTNVVVDDGELVAAYRKLHLYDALGNQESEHVTPGSDTPPVVHIDGMKIGVLTCYDLRFPEVFRVLVDAGAEAITISAAWVRGLYKEEHWNTLLRARAIENTTWIVASGEVGPRNSGNSQVIDPFGVIVAGAGEETTTCYAHVEAERVRTVRAKLPSLEHRRYSVVMH